MAWPGTEADRIPVDIESGYGIPVIYSARVIEAVMKNLVCVGAVDTTWRKELRVGDTLYIPVLSDMVAYQVDLTADWGAASLAHVNTNAFGTVASITVEKWYDCPAIISDGEKLQTQVPDLLGKMAKNAGYQIAKVIDTEVNELFDGLSTTYSGTDGQTFTDDLLISLMEGLDENDVPRSERSLIIDPSCLADMYKIDKFVHKDYNQTLTGEIGKTPYGDVILITNNLETDTLGNDAALLHKEAITCIIQMPPVVEFYRYAARHSDVVNTSAIFDAAVIRQDWGEHFYTRDQA